VPLRTVGRFTGKTVRMGRVEAPLSDLSAVFRSSFETTFS